MLLHFKHVGRRYVEGLQAVADVSLTIAPGEFISLVGPSGCGKSTLLKLAAGLDQPTSGQIERDAVLAAPGAIAFVFQDPTLMPWATVAENVWLPLRLRGIAWRHAKPEIDRVLAVVGLREFSGKTPAALSGGMKMRVSIARAMVTSPRLLLMDEPFAALDDLTRRRLNQDLLRWWESAGMSVVFVTHQLSEAIFLSQRIVVMGSRPGSVIHELCPNAPLPREEGFRTSSVFHESLRQLSDVLESNACLATTLAPTSTPTSTPT